MNLRSNSPASEIAETIDCSSMDAAVGVLQGQSGCTDLNPLIGIWTKDQDSYADEAAIAPKARKPYTITKQRERWSKAEHIKFLEAVQLHGRAWRRIEEHIGTKTAVQIRSHAQKFVHKMARDANDNGISDVKPIEIPPPRPKKKPTHPYPRKQVLSSTKEIKVLGVLERSSSPIFHVSEQDSSPTSGLTIVRSDSVDLDPFLSKNSNGSASSVGLAPESNNNESGISSPKHSSQGDNISLGLTPTELTTEDEPRMELDMNPSSEEATVQQTLKLFGRTLVVADSCKQSSDMISESNCNAMELDSGKQSEEVINGEDCATNETWPVGFLPAYYCLSPLYRNEANLTLPLLPFYVNMSIPCAYEQLQMRSIYLNQSDLQNDCSGSGSNTDNECANAVESMPDERGDERVAGFRVVRKARKLDDGSRAVKCSKGFVPYRREQSVQI